MRNEQDRQAFYRDIKENEHKEQVRKWLQDNPEVGTLSSGKHYYFNGDVYTEVQPLTVIK